MRFITYIALGVLVAGLVFSGLYQNRFRKVFDQRTNTYFVLGEALTTAAIVLFLFNIIAYLLKLF